MLQSISEKLCLRFDLNNPTLQCDDVWQADNRKCMDIGDKGIQRSIPKDFPYVYVQWSGITGAPGAFAHVIEDEKVFRYNFAQEVLAGMLDIPLCDLKSQGIDKVSTDVRIYE